MSSFQEHNESASHSVSSLLPYIEEQTTLFSHISAVSIFKFSGMHGLSSIPVSYAS